MEISSENPLPVGFRFQPTEQELVLYYLNSKAMNLDFEDPTNRFQELDLYNFTPPQLREKYGVQKEREMYFFVKKVLKFSTGKRLQRRTADNGHWRASTKESNIEFNGRVVGHRRNLVYHKGKGRGGKTNWLMCEYRLPDDIQLGDWLLCKVYLNEKEQLKTQVKLVSDPPPVPIPHFSGDIVEEASTSSMPPESSSSLSSRTSKQSTAMIESDSYIHRPDSKKIVIYYMTMM
ncbi:hypothetical protein TIFTF001_023337 [Ficus carica]|uniref:NAC domain-containing protein n=1 Tax=Ficus carica TaxID=3494 RepID=A0AA88AZZ7_FICCA|nr:hypothetical protein TIFTF001_023337 [Ficus carica]